MLPTIRGKTVKNAFQLKNLAIGFYPFMKIRTGDGAGNLSFNPEGCNRRPAIQRRAWKEYRQP